MEDKSDLTLGAILTLIILFVGLYFSPYWEDISGMANGIGILGLGMFFMFYYNHKLKKIVHKVPTLIRVGEGVGKIFLVTSLLGVSTFFGIYYGLLENNEYVLMIFHEKYIYFGLIIMSTLMFLIAFFQSLQTETKIIINRLIGIEIFNISLDQEYMNKKVQARAVKSFDLKDYEKFNFDESIIVEVSKADLENYEIVTKKVGRKKVPVLKKEIKVKALDENNEPLLDSEGKYIYDTTYKVKVFKRKVMDSKGEDLVKTIFKEDVYVEDKPIWVFNIHKAIRELNPSILEWINSSLNKPKITKDTYRNVMSLKKHQLYRILIKKMYKNYRIVAGNSPIKLESIFKKFDNQIELVVFELTHLCTINLSNFAIGQLTRFYKRINSKDDFREFMGCIDIVSSTRVKTSGMKYYFIYYMYKRKIGERL